MATDTDVKTRRDYTARRLYARQRIFQIIALILLGLIIYDTYIGDITWWVALIAIVIGLILGFIMGRLVRVRWDVEAQQVVTHMDIVGIIVIVLYIAFAFFRNALLSHWLTGAALTATSFALAAGILYGRYLGMRHSVNKVIHANVPQ